MKLTLDLQNSESVNGGVKLLQHFFPHLFNGVPSAPVGLAAPAAPVAPAAPAAPMTPPAPQAPPQPGYAAPPPPPGPVAAAPPPPPTQAAPPPPAAAPAPPPAAEPVSPSGITQSMITKAFQNYTRTYKAAGAKERMEQMRVALSLPLPAGRPLALQDIPAAMYDTVAQWFPLA